MAQVGTQLGFVSDADAVRQVAKDVHAADEMIKQIAKFAQSGWVVLGKALACIDKLRGWNGLGFKSFDEYVAKRFEGTVPRSSAYRAKALIEHLSPKIDDKTLAKIKITNAIHLATLPESIRFNPKTVANAVAMGCKEFEDFVDSKHVGAAKSEPESMFKIAASLKKMVNRAIEVGKFFAESEDDKDGLEYVSSYFLNSKCEIEGYANLSNLEAFHAMKKKTKKTTVKA